MYYKSYFRKKDHAGLRVKLTNPESKKVNSIIHVIQHYVFGHVSETMETRNFVDRTQVGELFNDFLVSLQTLG